MGPKIRLQFERYGFYPAGGGRFSAEIEPVKTLTPLHLGKRGEITSRRVIAVIANLPRHIAQREVETAADMLNWGPETHVIEATRESTGPGNVTMVEIKSVDNVGIEVSEIFTAFGQLGVSAEKVAGVAAREAREYLVSSAVADEHLSDQLLLPMALAGSGSFTATKMNLHARTNIGVIERFLAIRYEVLDGGGLATVSIGA
jgi:RNA 3'-terminal phosphate cyclase (ATP)